MTLGFSCVTASSLSFHTANSGIYYIHTKIAERHQNKENQTHLVCHVPSKASEPPTPIILNTRELFSKSVFWWCFHWHSEHIFVEGRQGRVKGIEIHQKKRSSLQHSPFLESSTHAFLYFSGEVKFQISLSALSRLLDCFPQEEKHTSRECVAFNAFTHPCTLCQTRGTLWFRCREASSGCVFAGALGRRSVAVKRGRLNFTPHTQTRTHSPGFACVGNDCPYCRPIVELPNPSVLCEWLSPSKAGIHAHTWPSREGKNEAGALEKFRCVKVHRATACRQEMVLRRFPCQAEGQITQQCDFKCIISIFTRWGNAVLERSLIGEMSWSSRRSILSRSSGTLWSLPSCRWKSF